MRMDCWQQRPSNSAASIRNCKPASASKPSNLSASSQQSSPATARQAIRNPHLCASVSPSANSHPLAQTSRNLLHMAANGTIKQRAKALIFQCRKVAEGSSRANLPQASVSAYSQSFATLPHSFALIYPPRLPYLPQTLVNGIPQVGKSGIYLCKRAVNSRSIASH
jgi:hypothetical protein